MKTEDIVVLVFAGVTPLLLLGGGGCLVLYQVLGWLQTGHWMSMTLADGLHSLHLFMPPLEWVGVQQILDWVGSWSLSTVLLTTGAFMAFGFYGLLQDAKRSA